MLVFYQKIKCLMHTNFGGLRKLCFYCLPSITIQDIMLIHSSSLNSLCFVPIILSLIVRFIRKNYLLSVCSSYFFSWKCLNYNDDSTPSANALAPTERPFQPWQFACSFSIVRLPLETLFAFQTILWIFMLAKPCMKSEPVVEYACW